MQSNSKLYYAIAAILGSTPVGLVHAATATDTATADSDAIQEITVTAQRRDESIENVPITIQAITGDTLKQLNVQTFDDLIKYTPNVSYSGNGPGLGNIFIRGLSSGGSGNQSQSTTAPFPNVAVYLDDESLQFPARNLDVYLVDMERVEVLEGPQGTLFGGGAQAGALRYITNKPKLDVTEGNVNASYGITASGGDPNSAVNATINLPLIADTLAVRATIFDDHRGGYISNVPGTITLPPATCVAATCPTANNAALVGNDLNTVDYTGARLSLLWKINENWNVLLSQNYQNMQSDGYFDDYPISSSGTPLAPYQITAFAPAYDKDKYEATSWTLNGSFGDLFGYGPLKLVYTGSYLDRNIDQQNDYSNYLKSGGGSSYACTGAGARYFVTSKATTCYAPVGSWRDQVKTTHESHEIRLSTSDDNRWRGLFGAYWEKFVVDDNMNFNYLAIPQCNAANLTTALAGGPDCVSAIGPEPGAYASDPSLREGSNTAFGEDAQRGYKQTAFFLSTDFDIIPKVLTLTGGTRYFHYDEFEEGSEYYTESSSPLVIDHPNGACTAAGDCGFLINKSKTENGFKSRGNLTWHVTPDTMVYYTYSQGFRPGGFNRSTNAETAAYTCATGNRDAGTCTHATENQYYKPNGFDSDDLVNNEIGVKSEFFEHRVQVNASAYRMKWSNVQLPLFDPTGLGNTTFVVNGPTYVIKGLELQLVARVTEALTIQGSSSYNNSKQTNSPCLISDVPTTAKNTNPTPLGDCITQIKNSPYISPFGVDGTTPAYSPLEQFNLRARYDLNFGEYKPFVMVGANHVGSMRNEPASFPTGTSSFCSPVPTTTLCQYTMPGYTTYDGTLGVAKDNWTAQLSGANLTNSHASQNTSSGQFIESMVPLRPRVLTATIGYKF
jgi:outer membrane receptor protein involved in Fe transport